MSFNAYNVNIPNQPLLIAIWQVADDGICFEVASWATHNGLQVVNPAFREDDFVAWGVWSIANGFIGIPALYLMSLVLNRGNQGIIEVYDTPVGLHARHPDLSIESPVVAASVPNMTTWPPRSK